MKVAEDTRRGERGVGEYEEERACVWPRQERQPRRDDDEADPQRTVARAAAVLRCGRARRHIWELALARRSESTAALRERKKDSAGTVHGERALSTRAGRRPRPLPTLPSRPRSQHGHGEGPLRAQPSQQPSSPGKSGCAGTLLRPSSLQPGRRGGGRRCRGPVRRHRLPNEREAQSLTYARPRAPLAARERRGREGARAPVAPCVAGSG